jgi:hypothetical protein
MDTNSVICEAGREIDDLTKRQSSNRKAAGSCSDLREYYYSLCVCMFFL